MKFHLHIWIILLIFSLVGFMILDSISAYEAKVSENRLTEIEETVERYALLCYATEGAYPPDIDYLVENYGLVVNRDKYIYAYEPIAENIRPQVDVYLQIEP